MHIGVITYTPKNKVFFLEGNTRDYELICQWGLKPLHHSKVSCVEFNVPSLPLI